MNERHEDLQQRLAFIDRTIAHAACACHNDGRVPAELKQCVDLMGRRTNQAQQALQACDVSSVKQNIDALAQLSQWAQTALHPADGMAFQLKSAVILTHIELSALKHQLTCGLAKA